MNTQRDFNPLAPSWYRYHEQFYGTEIPESMRTKIAKPFADMVGMMMQDLSEAHSGFSDECKNRAILAGLGKMREMDVDYLGAYANELNVKKDVFRTMSGVVKRHKMKEHEEKVLREMRAERDAAPVVTENPRAKVINDQFTTFQDYWYGRGLDRYESSIRAFCDVLKENTALEGIQYYVIFKIPLEREIRNDQRVIDALNAHPQLPNDHGPVRMTINTRTWKGFAK